jgi:cardiolipin synthase (CMP-forming)
MHIPLMLTFFRVIIIPFVMIFRIFDYPYISAFFFLLGCASDFLDGFLARAWQQTSKLGQCFDPIADKMFVSLILMMLVGIHNMNGLILIPCSIILSRELMVSGLREFLGHENLINVTSLAKIKTFMQMASLFLLLIPNLFDIAHTFGYISLWISSFMTIWTGYLYIKSSRKFLF